jgi:cation diffusion facilitator family transporter
LNDWLEVDTIVEAMADQILDSMNPDADHDGIIDRPGGIQDVGGHIEELLPEEDRENRRRAARNARWAININVIANILLLAAKGFAALSSSSLSLIASLVDSALDLLCTAIVWTTNRLVAWRLKGLERRFPVGRRRLEPLGILVFSVIMIISFVQILQESVTKLYKGISGTPMEAATLPPVAIGAMAATVIIKGIIWFGCIRVKTTQVQALAQDCKTDVYFNTLSLLFPLIGHQAHVWWLDPLGAALLSLFIIYDWAGTCFENVARLCGSAVNDSLQKKLTFLAYRFSPLVDGFKSITAYHAGDGVWAEYDVLLDGKTPLRSSHDIAETLQYCCEGLDVSLPHGVQSGRIARILREIDVLLTPLFHCSHKLDPSEELSLTLRCIQEVDRAFVTTDCECDLVLASYTFNLWLTVFVTDSREGPTGHAAI